MRAVAIWKFEGELMAKTMRTILILMIIGLGIGVFFALRPRQQKGSPEKLRAASVLILEGPLKSYGEQVRTGINLALEDIHQQEGEDLEVTFKSFDGDPLRAEDEVRTAVLRDQQGFVIEVFGTSAALQVSDFVNQNHVVTVSGVDTGYLLTKKMGKYFFRIIPSDQESVKALLKWAKDLHADKVTVIAVTTDWGKGVADMVEESSHDFQLKVTRMEVDKSQTLFEPIVSRLKSRKDSTVILAVNPDQAGNFVRATQKFDFHPNILGTDNLTAGEFTSTAGDTAVGIRYVLPPTPKKNDIRNTVIAKLRSRLGLAATEDPHPFALYGYDETWLVYRAMKAAHGDPDKAVSFLESYKGVGATGPLQFDKQHDVVLSGNYRRMSFRRDATAKVVADEVTQ